MTYILGTPSTSSVDWIAGYFCRRPLGRFWGWLDLKDTKHVILNATIQRWASCQIRKITGCACAGMPETFSPPPRVSDPDMHHDKCVTNVPWCMPGSLTNVFLWSRCWGKRSGHSRCMRNPQIYVSGKRPMWYRVHYVTFHYVFQRHFVIQLRLHGWNKYPW